jgi:hypothetical protein
MEILADMPKRHVAAGTTRIMVPADGTAILKATQPHLAGGGKSDATTTTAMIVGGAGNQRRAGYLRPFF